MFNGSGPDRTDIYLKNLASCYKYNVIFIDCHIGFNQNLDI